ncbi:MAG: phosphate acyltransferase PlsX [Ignavibacteriota bacterium]|nr:MAG: phosphate acyltransferase PlsX [Chlorobiota bacterium]MBE7477160.1 phosphate acyltransferase PlsX [Ignavibacteriales bacterium]MBL1121362.1 phosphate acyltransferase PlsX [Ignavibacteriota bacterium]MBV6419655.1 Phosphate acyltransferase [Ignavibacteriaceae bacterium]MCE7855196.1 phosphate acyltransferase PlsX [Ignavibacteria bacterium CHB3]MEB2297495.1 phosphate acyltransferase PlsX [Ignavibacteria bacterium]
MKDSGDNSSRCRIVVDAMGGDFAPVNAVLGAVEAYSENRGFDLYLVGKQSKIKEVLSSNNITFPEEFVVNADEVIEMADSPASSLKAKPNSSIVIGAQLVRDKKADAFVSAGNTGAMMAASTLIIGRISGLGRPTIGAEMPNVNGICYLYDVGASKDSKPIHLFEYAVMGTIFAKEMGGVTNPKVGVLSMGEEEGKGNEVSEAAAKMLRQSKLNFIGNVEGRDILTGNVDVVVCDGYVGNIILKFGESVPKLLKYLLAKTAEKSFLDKILIGLSKSTLKKALKSLDYQEYGGVPLLGVNGISIIGHGSSSIRAIKNMVLRANEMHQKQLVQKMTTAISEYSVLN